MRDELDELLGDFARDQLAGQIGKITPAFAKARARQTRNRRIAMSSLAAVLALVAAVHFRPAAKVTAIAPQQPAFTGGAEMVSGQVWYRDVPGPLVVLDDHTPAQIVYRQVYQVYTTVQSENKAIQTQAVPAQLTLLVPRPVY